MNKFRASRTGMSMEQLIRSAWIRATFEHDNPVFVHGLCCPNKAKKGFECSTCDGDEMLRKDICDVWHNEECAEMRKKLSRTKK